MSTLRIGRHSIDISNEDKLYFPGEGITKGEVIEYYRRIAKVMLPYMKGRPVTMHRFPDGIQGEGFYQKETPDYFPDWIRRVTVEKEGGRVTHPVCDDAASLAYLASQGCLTPHTWLSRADRADYPDLLVFDLDPSGSDFGAVCAAAEALKDVLEKTGLAPFVKTTGSRGLHVVARLNRRANFDAARALARRVAELVAESDPDRITMEQRKNKRRGRVYIDIMRNAYAQTFAPPYAVRPEPGAPVSAPLGWDELRDGRLRSQTYNIRNIWKRIGRGTDAWAGMPRHAGSVKAAAARLDGLLQTVRRGARYA